MTTAKLLSKPSNHNVQAKVPREGTVHLRYVLEVACKRRLFAPTTAGCCTNLTAVHVKFIVRSIYRDLELTSMLCLISAKAIVP